MAAETVVVPYHVLEAANTDTVAGQPLCPHCKHGYLQPYLVQVGLSGPEGDGWRGASGLTGWVAVCEGNARHNERMRQLYERANRNPDPDDLVEQQPCGFTLPMQGWTR